MLSQLQTLSQEFLQTKQRDYRRYFIRDTKLSERFSILTGQRGIGKTTLIIQYLLDYVHNDIFSPKILYVQADHFAIAKTTLYEIAEQFNLMGGEFIAFDEIHKYQNWSMELKSINDTFDKLKIIASGSSALEIHKGSHDLSRRAIVYKVKGLSLRESLELALGVDLPTYQLPDILINHQSFAKKIISILSGKKKKIQPLFKQYLTHGFYPYYYELNDDVKFKMTLEQNIHTTLESDLASIYPQLTNYSINKIKLLLGFIAENVPFSPNWKKLTRLLEIGDERTVKSYFKYLEDAQLVAALYNSSKQLKKIDSPVKIFLQNPNLMYAITPNHFNIGTAREIFLYNMLMNNHSVTSPLNGDFLIDDTILLEVGGKNKDSKQIYRHKNAYLACDDIEMGVSNKIPLWLFGFLY